MPSVPLVGNSRERLFIPQETNFATLRYKGNFWSRMKGRDDERTSATPGPGCYEHETKKSPGQIRDERIREAKRAAAKQPRFLEALCRQKLRQVILRTRFATFVPSPHFPAREKLREGAISLYMVHIYVRIFTNYFMKISFLAKRTFQLPIVTIYREAYSISTDGSHVSVILTRHSRFLLIRLRRYVPHIAACNYWNFYSYSNYREIIIYQLLSSFKRFEEKVYSDTPGPGAYDVAIRQICYGSILNAPFGACSGRFKRAIGMITPGMHCCQDNFHFN